MNDIKRYLLPLVILLAVSSLAYSTDEIYFAWWNVQNLFDATDDPYNEKDDEYLPPQWTQTHLETKIDHLAQIISEMNAGRGPSLLGVCEVENRGVLQMLVWKHFRDKYALVHWDSSDSRGIDVAFIYDKRRLVVQSVSAHTVPQAHYTRPTRDIIKVEFENQGNRLFVIGNHWPSRSGGQKETELYRINAAKVCRGIVDKILTSDEKADILILGDFNDEPNNDSLHEHLKAMGDKAALQQDNRRLYNTAWSTFEAPNEGTYYYFRGQVWNMLDQVIVSHGLLNPKGFSLNESTVEVYTADGKLRNSDGYPKRFRTIEDNSFEGYSDHFPIVGVLVSQEIQ